MNFIKNKKGETDLFKKVLGIVLVIAVVVLIITIANGGLGSIGSIFANFFPDSLGPLKGESNNAVSIDDSVPAIMYDIAEDGLYYRANGEWRPYQAGQKDKVGGEITEDLDISKRWMVSFQNYWYDRDTSKSIILSSGNKVSIQKVIKTTGSTERLPKGDINLRSFIIAYFVKAPEKKVSWYSSAKYLNYYLISYDDKFYRQEVETDDLFKAYGRPYSADNKEELEVRDKVREWRESIRNKPIPLSLVRNGKAETSYFCTIKLGTNPNSLVVDFSKPVSSGDIDCRTGKINTEASNSIKSVRQREVTASYPAGCVGGNPVVVENCLDSGITAAVVEDLVSCGNGVCDVDETSDNCLEDCPVGTCTSFEYSEWSPCMADVTTNVNDVPVNVNDGFEIKYNSLENSFYQKVNGEWQKIKYSDSNIKLNSEISITGDLTGWYKNFVSYWYDERKRGFPNLSNLSDGKEFGDIIFPSKPLISGDGKTILKNYIIVYFLDAERKGYDWGIQRDSLSPIGWSAGFKKDYSNYYLISYDGKLYRQKLANASLFDSYEIIKSPKGSEKELLGKIIKLRDSPIKKNLPLILIRNGVLETNYFCPVISGQEMIIDLNKPVEKDKECD